MSVQIALTGSCLWCFPAEPAARQRAWKSLVNGVKCSHLSEGAGALTAAAATQCGHWHHGCWTGNTWAEAEFKFSPGAMRQEEGSSEGHPVWRESSLLPRLQISRPCTSDLGKQEDKRVGAAREGAHLGGCPAPCTGFPWAAGSSVVGWAAAARGK